jgi:hypothetical protein
MTSRLDQRRLNVAIWDCRGEVPSTKSCIKVFLSIMITCTNALAEAVGLADRFPMRSVRPFLFLAAGTQVRGPN